MNILDGLNEKQREAVTHKNGPLLVIAGPGTGKTRVITHRIAYLIREYGIKPENILAITFTNKAAQEMQERVIKEIGGQYGSRVKICTFHTFCHRTLRQHPSEIAGLSTDKAIELDEHFTILDQEAQDNLLIEIVQELNFNSSNYRPRRLLNIISNLKGNLQELTEASEFSENGIPITDEEDVTKIRCILETYQSKLEERNVLDFDDLLFKTVKLFEKFSDITETYHKEISHILVDEYHDVNKAQYQLLQLLSASSEQNLMVVADRDQAIYSWRGSNPEYIDRFKADFTPHTVGLEQHYRCTQTILNAAKDIILKNPDPNRPSLKTDNPIGEKIVHCTFSYPDEIGEAKRIIKLIRDLKRIGSENFNNEGQPSRIAILYRNHKFANVLTEQLALQNDIPFRRWIQSTNSFQEIYRKAIVSYLSLVESETSSDIEHAINFPEMCIDELTLVRLKRIARRKKIGLVELLKDIDSYPQQVGPLTRQNIRQFWERIHKFVADVKIENEKASRIVPKLLDILERSRSPYRNEELEIIENSPKAPNITDAQGVLHRAIEGRKRIHIIASYGIDEYCAAHILHQTLETYLNQTVQVQFLLPNAGQPQITDKGIHLLIGDFDELERQNADTHILLIGTVNNRNVDVIQLEHASNFEESSNTNTVRSITALKLCQCLTGSFEIQNTENIVVYDLETTGVDIETANIVEIASSRLGVSGNEIDEYHQLVKPPDGHIPEESTKIHKITEEMVKNSPGIKAVLPKFCDFIQDNILVGHNIAQFDNRILERVIKEYLEEDKEYLTNLYYDTLVAARRLFPHERRSLGALASKFGIFSRLNINQEDLHNAGNDVKVNREVFKELIATDCQKREMKSLTEFLPLVGLGILAKIEASQIEVSDTKDTNTATAGRDLTETDAFLNAAKRFVQTHSSQNYTADSLLQVDSLLLEQSEKRKIGAFMGKLRQAKIPNSTEDIEWKEERADMIKDARHFEEISGNYRLQSFINYQTRMMNAVRRFEEIGDKGENAHEQTQSNISHEPVTLMSLHTAKGTEFDVVIILGMEDGIFPEIWHWRSEAIQEERLKEERRLFYVAMTRAKKRLYLSTSMYRFYEKQGDRFLYDRATSYSSEDQNRAASVFIHEIPSDYIQKWPPQE